MTLDEQPLRIIPGTGTITRTEHSVIVCSSADMALVNRLSAVVTDSTAMAREILSAATPPTAVAVLHDTSLFLFGSVRATVHRGGETAEISVDDAPGGVTHQLLAATSAITVSTSEWGSDDDTDLQRGTVRGQGFAIGFAHSEPEIGTFDSVDAAAVESISRPVDTLDDPLPPPPVDTLDDPLPPPPVDVVDDPLPPPPVDVVDDPLTPPPVEAAEPTAPLAAQPAVELPAFVIANLKPENYEEPTHQPLPLSGAEAPADQRPHYQQPVTVHGVMSSAGHFNHPFASYCRISGEKLNVGKTWISVEGVRPPLGVLNFDDGRSFVINWNTIAGRQPESDSRVQEGAVGPLALVAEQTMSRAHLLFELREWDVFVTDLSVNGVELLHENAELRERLPQGEAMPLVDGDTILFGGRTCVYHSH